jgi:hypothetical protein
MSRKSRVNDEIMIEAIKTSYSYREVSRKVGLSEKGSNSTIKNCIKKYSIDISHMTGAGWNKGDKLGILKRGQEKRTIPLCNILVENSAYTSTDKLRKRLLKENVKEYKCERCSGEVWNNSVIPLEIHHINGIRSDNRIENLLLLCPNCHAQTNTYRGKNANSGVRKISPKKKAVIRNLPDIACGACGKIFRPHHRSTIFCSNYCAHSSLRKFEVSKEDLEKLVWEKPTSKVAEEFGVSHSAIRKRCSKLGIARPPWGYWQKLAVGKL